MSDLSIVPGTSWCMILLYCNEKCVSRCAFMELSPCIMGTTLVSLNIFVFWKVVCQSPVKLKTVLGGLEFVDLG